MTTAHSVATGGPMIDTDSGFAQVWGGSIGIVGGAFFVYLYARRIGRFLSSKLIAHGLVVAVAAAVLHVLSSLGSGDKLGVAQYAVDALKLAAGAVGGWVASRNV